MGVGELYLKIKTVLLPVHQFGCIFIKKKRLLTGWPFCRRSGWAFVEQIGEIKDLGSVHAAAAGFPGHNPLNQHANSTELADVAAGSFPKTATEGTKFRELPPKKCADWQQRGGKTAAAVGCHSIGSCQWLRRSYCGPRVCTHPSTVKAALTKQVDSL
jgi:hypothetical protein